MGLYKGKRVAIVGSAATAVDSHFGKYIDAHDIVVRFNNVIEHLPFSDKLKLDTGSKTDVVYMSVGHVKKYMKPEYSEILKKSIENCNISNIICVRGSNLHIKCKNTQFSSINSQINTILAQKFKEIGGSATPTTGLLAIMDVLLQEPKEVFVCGFSFSHGGGHNFKDFKNLNPLGNLINSKLKKQIIKSYHVGKFELAVFKKLLEEYGDIRLDDFLQYLTRLSEKELYYKYYNPQLYKGGTVND